MIDRRWHDTVGNLSRSAHTAKMRTLYAAVRQSNEQCGAQHPPRNSGQLETQIMPFTKTIPILRILDEVRAKAFYVDFLGFKLDWGNRATGALFMQVSLDECVLHLSEHSGD